MVTIKPTIGVFAIIFNCEGKLLVKQRGEDESLPGDWDLPGGGVEESVCETAKDERVIGHEVAREVMEETGLDIADMIQPMPALYAAVLPARDWALATIIGIVEQAPTKGNYKYVSPEELLDLAEGPVGNRLVSGAGKRMHRLCLRGLASRDSPNPEYREMAGKMLFQIQEGWS